MVQIVTRRNRVFFGPGFEHLPVIIKKMEKKGGMGGVPGLL